MSSMKQTTFIFILLQNLLIQCSSQYQGTVTTQYGRISNVANQNIHVSHASTLDDCVRLCAAFSKTFSGYLNEDCFAYNYDHDYNTCELIHSLEPLNYEITLKQSWKTGFKYAE